MQVNLRAGNTSAGDTSKECSKVPFRIRTAAFIGFALVHGSFAMAQIGSQTPQPQPTSTAVVDLDHILDSHPSFMAQMEGLKAEYQKAMEDFEGRRKKLAADATQLNDALTPDSPEFKKKQETLVGEDSKLRLEVVNKEKEFGERQARLIMDTYNQVVSAVDIAAKHYKYDIVVRYSRKQATKMDPKKPNTVQIGLDREVIFFNPQHDLTDTIVAMLKRDVQSTPAATNGARAPQTANPAPGGQIRR
jgi:Skp family chaperone for outer membrane proteins